MFTHRYIKTIKLSGIGISATELVFVDQLLRCFDQAWSLKQLIIFNLKCIFLLKSAFEFISNIDGYMF